jgi:TonB-linked SusC/RagA family outer membrane protein
MKLYYILKKMNFFIGLFLVSILLTEGINAQIKTTQQKKVTTDVNLKVTDEDGIPIPKAKVVVGEGIIHAETDENGVYSFKAYLDQIVSITVPGYEKITLLVQEVIKDNNIRLKKSKLFMTTDDDIHLPYITVKKRTVTGSYSVITGDRLEKYPSIDIRNSLTGLATGVNVRELNGQPGISAEESTGGYHITEKINVSARGRSMTYIVDEIPMNITEIQFNPSEIETVTIIKDIVGKTMFGPMGADGIILIKTKRGYKNERVTSINIEDGVSLIDRMPGWTSGADYARLNNIARLNDGLESLYDESDISAYEKNDPYDMYHPNIDFKSMMLKSTRQYTRANVTSKGGSEMIQYFAYLGYDREGDIYKIGPNAGFNNFTGKSNIYIQINELVKVQATINGSLNIRNSPNYGYATGEGSSLTDILEFNAVVDEITSIPPVAFPVYANNDPSLATPWYGVSNTFKSNPVANLTRNGSYTETGRTALSTVALDYDLKNIVKGLKSRTLLGFNSYYMTRIGKAQDYAAYIVTPSISPVTGNDTILLTRSKAEVSSSALVNLHDYFFNRLTVYENLSYNKSFGLHNFQTGLTYYYLRTSRNQVQEPQRQLNGVWSILYSFNDKYSLHGVLNYAGTYWQPPEKRFDLFPAIGASWVISEENFMSNLKFIDYLKFRVEAGMIGYENFLPAFLYRDNFSRGTGTAFGPFTTGQWFGTTSETNVYSTSISRTGNPKLTWEKRKEFTAGFDALMLNNKLSLELNYYSNLRSGEVDQVSNTLPLIAGVSSWLPYINYNDIRLFGLEAGIQYTGKSGNLNYVIGGSATIQNSKLKKYDSPNYRYDYQTRIGRSADTYWGQTCLGKFDSDEEAMVIPQLYSDVLREGDLKYKDMNGDGVVDDNDMSALGHTSPRLFYGINAIIRYKNIEMTVLGTGMAFFDLPLTNRYFWNGWGDGNFSNFVKDNIGGAYPRLTYYKVINNFVNSDFWLTKGDFFKLQNVELAYNLPVSKLLVIRSQGVRFFVRGANLLTISKVKNVDPESIDSGVDVYPLYRTFSTGIKFMF